MTLAPTETEYSFICQLVYEHSRINLGNDKRELVAARLGKRLRATNSATFKDYCNLLKRGDADAEIGQLVDVISTNHTHFFREPKHFEFLMETALPEFERAGDPNFRIWSAASSSGEEPYSLAMLLGDHATSKPSFNWRLDCSDICTKVLDTAKQGVYADSRLNDVRPDMLRRHFQKGTGKWEGHYRVKENLRNRIRWERINLFQDSYPFNELFHVIFCRNVMIYFDRPSQEQLVAKLARQLVPGGYLMIGHSESLTGIRHDLKTIRPAIYRKS